ncbi:MAG TPA: hypothetical protein V6D25_30915 [Leptolyngbyaceae cyanobacterium]
MKHAIKKAYWLSKFLIWSLLYNRKELLLNHFGFTSPLTFIFTKYGEKLFEQWNFLVIRRKVIFFLCLANTQKFIESCSVPADIQEFLINHDIDSTGVGSCAFATIPSDIKACIDVNGISTIS